MADSKLAAKSLTLFYQVAIVLASVAVLVFVVDFFFVSGTRAQTSELHRKLEQLQRENKSGSLLRENIKGFEKSLKDSQQELESLKSLLPEAVQLSDVLQTIQAKARKENLILRVFRPGAANQKDYYNEKPILIDVSGSYHNIGNFFADMAGFERINNISDVEIFETDTQTERVSVSSSFTVTVYFLSEQNINNMNRGKDEGEKDGKNAKKSSKGSKGKKDVPEKPAKKEK